MVYNILVIEENSDLYFWFCCTLLVPFFITVRKGLPVTMSAS